MIRHTTTIMFEVCYGGYLHGPLNQQHTRLVACYTGMSTFLCHEAKIGVQAHTFLAFKIS